MSVDFEDIKTAKIGFMHMPRAFYALLFIEFWERFAFYGFQSIILSYLIHKLHFSSNYINYIFISFSALMYSFLVLGGYVGDKILGLRRTYFLGILLLVLGYIFIIITDSEKELYFSLGLIIFGNVFFKPISSDYINRIFETNDPRLDAAYTYFYMLVNLGSFAGIIAIPRISHYLNHVIGLIICVCSIGVSLISYFIFIQRLSLSDNQVGKITRNKNTIFIVLFVISIFLAYLMSILFNNFYLCQNLFYFFCIIVFAIYLLIAVKLPRNEANGMYLALILLFQALVFWVFYILLFNSIEIFIHNYVKLSFFNLRLPSRFTQIFNPLYIIILSPILANLYTLFYKKKMNVGIPTKFMFGIFILSFSFFLLGIIVDFYVDANNKIPVFLILLVLGFYSVGELFIIALGTSMVAKLLPKRIGGFAQTIWYVTSALGVKIGSIIASVALYHNNVKITYNLTFFSNLFYSSALAILFISLLTFIILKPINKAYFEFLEHK